MDYNPPAPFQGRPQHAIRAAASALYALPSTDAVLAAIRETLANLANHAETRAETDRLHAVISAIDSVLYDEEGDR